MEKRTTKNKFLVYEIIFVVLIFICWISIFLLYKATNNNYSKKKPLEKQIIYNKKSLNEKANELKGINSDIEYYNNIDKNIENTKKEYFSNIKKLEDDILSGNSDKKIAYMTFDDGPYYNTYKVLDILDEYNVKATFFTISLNGQYCFDNKSVDCFNMYQEYVKRGHTIANHTYTHAIFRGLYSSADSFIDSINRQEEHIKQYASGYTTNITRFPGGSSTAGNLKNPIMDKLREKGYGWVDWTAEDGDGKSLSSKEQAWNILMSTLNDKIEVILFHDYNSYTTQLLPDIITYLKDNGYEIYPLFYESNMINK